MCTILIVYKLSNKDVLFNLFNANVLFENELDCDELGAWNALNITTVFCFPSQIVYKESISPAFIS